MPNTLTERGILGRMYQRIETAPAGWIDEIAMRIASDQQSEEHKWLGQVPAMSEFKGQRLIKGLRSSGQIIPNVEYEASIEVRKRELRGDKTGQIMARINGLVDRALTHPRTLISTLLLNGPSSICYDGQFFFDTDHSEGDSGSQSNDISADISTYPVSNAGTTTAPSAGEMAYAILAAIQAMYGFKDDVGEPMNEGASRFQVQVPISLLGAAMTATSVLTFGAGESNPLAGLNINGQSIQISVIANPRLTWTDSFAVLRADQADGAAPFILQEEMPVTPNVEVVQNGKVLNYSADWDGGAGYGFWQHGVYVTLT